MSQAIITLGQAVLLAAGMFWAVGWSLVLGLAISALLQAVVDKDSMVRALGRDGTREIVLATLAGAASSSCSYAATAVSRTLLKKGAALVPSLAFIFASTNLVVELGIVLCVLMGWPFMAGEWLGGIVLVVVLTGLVRLTYPTRLMAELRRAGEPAAGPAQPEPRGPLLARLRRRETWLAVARHFQMDCAMLWKDVVIGFLIAGALAAFVPAGLWQTLFLRGASPWLQVPANALIGPVVAMLSFVCSIGNVPMAAVLWGSGVSFGGVLAFLYADLLVLPLLDVYRRYFGWKMAAYIATVFYLTMVVTAVIMDLAFRALGWIPASRPALHGAMMSFGFNGTFWLNLVFGLAALALMIVARRNPAKVAGHCAHHQPAPVHHCCH